METKPSFQERVRVLVREKLAAQGAPEPIDVLAPLPQDILSSCAAIAMAPELPLGWGLSIGINNEHSMAPSDVILYNITPPADEHWRLVYRDGRWCSGGHSFSDLPTAVVALMHWAAKSP